MAEGKGRWIPLVYYYLATVVGLAFMLGGTTSSLLGVRRALVPQLSEDIRWRIESARAPEHPDDKPKKLSEQEKQEIEAQARQEVRLAGWGQALDGLIWVLVGGPVFFWHLRQARRKEPEWLAGG